MAESPDPSLSALRARREDCARALAQGLAQDMALPELQSIEQRLRLIDAALAETARPSARAPRWRAEVLALLVVGAIVSLGAAIRMPQAAFTLELQTGAMQWVLPQATVLTGQRLGGEVRAEGHERLESPDPAWQQRSREEGAGALSLRAERLMLRRIELGAGARVDWQVDGSVLRWAIDGAAHSGTVDFGGAIQSSLGDAPSRRAQIAVAEWLRLTSGGAPVQWWLARPADAAWVWRGLQPSSLRFIERGSDGTEGSARWQSALRKATLQLPATGATHALDGATVLEIDGARLERCEVIVGGDGLTLRASGHARQLRSVVAGIERSLKPSVLEYLARHHGLALFWSAGGVLWALVAWGRKLLGSGG